MPLLVTWNDSISTPKMVPQILLPVERSNCSSQGRKMEENVLMTSSILATSALPIGLYTHSVLLLSWLHFSTSCLRSIFRPWLLFLCSMQSPCYYSSFGFVLLLTLQMQPLLITLVISGQAHLLSLLATHTTVFTKNLA